LVSATRTWYWLCDRCEATKIPFVLGHALYLKAIHGGKVKNDKNGLMHPHMKSALEQILDCKMRFNLKRKRSAIFG
jgi:hypothetical protein